MNFITPTGKRPRGVAIEPKPAHQGGSLIRHQSNFPRGLSGYVPVRNGDKLDYCWREAVASLLPVCDEVWISVGLTAEEYRARCTQDEYSPDDGTLAAANLMADANPKIGIATDSWDDSLVNHKTMLKEWLNRIRYRCRFSSQITLDADEILDPCAHDRIRHAVNNDESLWFHRINLWRSPEEEAPHGTVCGELVARLGPTEYEMVSDGPEVPEAKIRLEAMHSADAVIWHMGFLRKPEAFYAKSKVMQRRLHNCYDPRLTKAEDEGKNWVDECPFKDVHGNVIPLRKHGRELPELAKAWLAERGYHV